TLTEDSDAGTVTFEEAIPVVPPQTAYYTGTLEGKTLTATGSYSAEQMGFIVDYDVTITATFSVPPDTTGVPPTDFVGFYTSNANSVDLGPLGSSVTAIVGEKQ
ncbi:MAG: hypothetical protein QF464_21840, partial [Myxococcota bacterium]|nr:hypothetical protein [Myxococcota bacterium]